MLFLRINYLGFLLPASIALYEMFVAIKHKEMFTTRHAWLNRGREL
jgi:hypothetical protein